MATQAWMINIASRTVEPILLPSRSNQNKDYRLLGPAYVEGVHPDDYFNIANILGAASPLKVEPWTVRSNKQSIYKVWTKDVQTFSGPTARFFKTDVDFFGEKLVLTKHEKPNDKTLDLQALSDHIEDDLIYYQAPAMLDCPQPRETDIIWGSTSSPVVRDINIREETAYTMKSEDLMYTCASCNKACGNLRCARCKKTFYCNTECQRNHWRTHKCECHA